MDNGFYLEIITPERVFFQGDVEGVVFVSQDGEYGVLKNHQPVVSTVGYGTIRIKKDGKWLSAAASEGFAEVGPKGMYILVQTAEWPEEIDEAKAREAASRAKMELQQKISLKEYHITKATLARALVRLRLSNRDSMHQD